MHHRANAFLSSHTQRGIIRLVIAFHHGALTQVLDDEAIRLVGRVDTRAGITVVLADAVREASNARALIRVDGHCVLRCRFSTRCTILTRTAVTLVHINVTVPTQSRRTRIIVALLYSTLGSVLHDEAVVRIRPWSRVTIVLTHTVREASDTRTLIGVVRHRCFNNRLCTGGTVLTWKA